MRNSNEIPKTKKLKEELFAININLVKRTQSNNILKFITFYNLSLCNKLDDKLYNEAMNLFFLILNNIHFIEVKNVFSIYLEMITKYQPLQEFYINLLRSPNKKYNDLFKTTYAIEFLYPVMQGRHQYKIFRK